ncbi:TadE/TadG family type IV pilus assembly protein [Ruegeria sp. HKCCA5426]|uniref:TadE/TadG family type IV pilus assembly protein n=1 Tax=Ruegeria sp. HKCCA5426 TaxID=2682985 RepID=UPI001488A072|nr:TadE/TadG family type IV pilus assembly protein [Ruegeria sp. HKCCA5426]
MVKTYIQLPEDSISESKSKENYLDKNSARDLFSRFRQESEGAVLILLAIFLVPMMVFIGLAMELALTEDIRVKLQNTSDSASLASADLEQVLEPEDVVNDFFAKAGLGDNLRNVTVVNTATERTVAVESDAFVPALLTRLAGRNGWDVPVVGAATESRRDLEIAVALDNSGSMSWAPGSTSGPAANPSRMDLLIPAAEAFVDAVQPKPGQPGTTTISLVPFATQVSVGEDLLNNFTVSAEHSTSHCVTFNSTADYTTTAVPTNTLLNRTAHHDPSSTGWNLSTYNTVCPTDSARRDIVAWSEDPDVLKTRIRAMQPYGYTSIEMAAKWGAAMLDPTMRPVLSSLSGMTGYEHLSGPAGRGMPYDFDNPDAIKYLIVMSDGANTLNFDIRPPYHEGNSPLFRLPGTNNYSYYRNRPGTGRDFYRVSGDFWSFTPGSGAVQMTWPEVWADMPVDRFVDSILSEADTSRSANGHYNRIVRTRTGTWKNNRTSAICQAAKDNDVIVFTIGMDTYGQGDATLADCASSPSHFYDVDGLDIDDAFASIARQINKLRLTQ